MAYYPQGYYPTYPQQSYYPAPQTQPQMTPPTIRAEIIQIEDEAAVDRFPLAAGASQMFMTRAEDKIVIKTMAQDGPMPLVVYVKRPPVPPKPEIDPAQFVTRDEIGGLIDAAVAHRLALVKEEA